MFISDVMKQDECRNEALKLLRELGVKCKPKKPKQQNIKGVQGVFKVPLGALPTEVVTLTTGQQMPVPKLVHELCSLILTKVVTEGIFRKEGSKVRQSEIKAALDGGGALDKQINIIDAAALLKTFFRELPEPLIPYSYHECFLRCALDEMGDTKTTALLLACLLLPIEHLNTLTYLLQFFNKVTQQSKKNKMNAYNIAVVVGPAVFPIEEKLTTSNAQARTSKICEIVEILVGNAFAVGVIPENIIERLGSSTSEDTKKKKRRSGSLTRMFNGLKKIVGGKSAEENRVVTPDLLLTPINSNAMKKRRMQNNGISTRKKKELLNKLPDNVLLNTPFTPCRTPVSMDLSGTRENHVKETNDLIKEKKSQWFSRSRSVKNLKQESTAGKKSAATKAILERRWSAIAPVNNLKKAKKRNSFTIITQNKEAAKNAPEPDYIRVSKIEYEAIKNRVSAMERRISIELESVQSQMNTDTENDSNEEVDINIQNVQTVYEQTLVQSTQLSPTTDQLARRLSRELKIRRSAEQKIIRSPSARKIGSMRRKSKENGKNSAKLSRHKSWHVAPRNTIPRVSLKRGKPNTVLTGLPMNKFDNGTLESKDMRERSSSVGEQHKKTVSCDLSGSSTETWVSADGFFATLQPHNDSNNPNGRASLARLRSQNAGMVLAKAKLFDKLSDSDSSSSHNLTRSIPRAKVGSKIGANRVDSRLSYRVRSLKYEERRLGKKSMSPRKRNGGLSQKHKLQIAKQYFNSSAEKDNSDKENIPDSFNSLDRSVIVRLKDCNRTDGQKFSSPKYSTPRVPPHIKKSLNVRSPKRLYRTPVAERSTPLRVLKTPIRSNM